MQTGIRRVVSRTRRAVRRRLTPPTGPLVLLYHRVANAAVDPWRLAVQPGHFAEHLDIIARQTRPMTRAELDRAIAAGSAPRDGIVVTFDDGYADLVETILPALERADVPATVFVVSRAIDRDREFWWDALAHALLDSGRDANEVSLRIDGAECRWPLGNGADHRAVHREVWATLRSRPPAERDGLAEAVLAAAGLATAPRPTHRTLRGPELERLAGHPLIEIGGHTANHAWLAGLPPEDRLAEIAAGRDELSNRLGRRIDAFAYPHGSREDLGPGTPGLVRQAGFAAGFLATDGAASPTDPWQRPRLFVENMDGDAFARFLRDRGGIGG